MKDVQNVQRLPVCSNKRSILFKKDKNKKIKERKAVYFFLLFLVILKSRCFKVLNGKSREIDSEIMEGLIRLSRRRVVVHCKTAIMCGAPSQLESFRYRKLCGKDISRFTTL